MRPADEMAALQFQITTLQKEASDLRAGLIAGLLDFATKNSVATASLAVQVQTLVVEIRTLVAALRGGS
jgi:hypothetical protein